MDKQTYFPLISGDISIDLINTEVIRWGTKHELLTDTEKLNDWLHILSEHNPSLKWLLTHKTDTLLNEDLKQLLLFRDSLRTLFEKNIQKQGVIESVHIEEIQLLANTVSYSFQLFHDTIIPIPNGTFYECIQSLIALNVLQLIANNQLQYLRHCQNEACILLFLDKTGRRKWCSMKICGNRNKVTKHVKNKKK
ncbi:CGNR zinc finger domain-containing protein [Bacillus pseudomycoides]|uniref:CGNR zinc finger domain-containing protein n=1 Tax=Bacillus bingmayongensis TaxID=1150157 RepID=A0ABU5JX13_9BACI|nr:CGNR zinc finger domain-containing protein [Bacillus pseudomycoides]